MYSYIVQILLFQLTVSCFFPLEQGVFFTSGLSDVTAIIGTDTELVCRLSSEDCDAVWYKDGEEVRNTAVDNVTLSTFIIDICKCVHISVWVYISDNNYRKYMYCQRWDLSQTNYKKLQRR